MSKFEQLTLVVLASTEQKSLIKSVELLVENCNASDIKEIIIFMISSDCPSAAIVSQILEKHYPVPIRVCVQQRPGLSPAIFEIPRCVQSSHFLVIGSDLEMNPLSVPKMIELSKEHPDAIICASKFQKGSHREHYGFLHYLCNRIVNAAVELILHIRGTELISTFQVYPLELFFDMGFDDPKWTFYEFTLRPLSLGTEYIEIATDYTKRMEGASNFNLKKYVDLGVSFLLTAVREKNRLKKQRKELSD